MTYFIGALAGLVLGGVIGYLKNLFIWRKYLDESASGSVDPNDVTGLYARAFISFTANILALAIAFFTRNLFPFDGIAFLIGTAVALTFMNKVLAMGQKKRENKRREDC